MLTKEREDKSQEKSEEKNNVFWSKAKKAVKALIFTAGFVCIFLSLTKLMQYKAAVTRIDPFFDIEEPIDVMLFGTSHVIDGVLPFELWGDYGISSYNFGNNAARIPLTYWMMENVFDYQVPKLVVVDCSYLSSDTKTSTTLQQAHNVLDAFPLTKTKRAAIDDLFEEEEKLEFLWPFSVYHDRWSELTKADFVVEYNDELGATPKNEVAVPAEYAQLAQGTKLANETLAMEYLGKLIESCKAQGVDVLLTYLPCPANSKRQKEANSAYDIAEKYGVNYINFLELADVVNYATDCNDADSHLNASGAKKVTEYLGAYILAHYDISDRREEKAFSSWNADYAAYAEKKMEAFKTQKTLSSYLMLLADKDVQSRIYVREDSVILQNERLAALLYNAAQYGFQSEVHVLDAEAFAAENGGDASADIRLEVSRADSGEPVDLTCFTVTKEQPLTIKRTQNPTDK